MRSWGSLEPMQEDYTSQCLDLNDQLRQQGVLNESPFLPVSSVRSCVMLVEFASVFKSIASIQSFEDCEAFTAV